MCLTNHKKPEFIPELVKSDLINLPELEFPDLSTVYKEMINCEEKVVFQVLEELLKRKPTIDDFKMVTRVFKPGVSDWYHLFYKDINLGIVELPYFKPNLRTNSISQKFTVTFKPNQEKHNS
jgi:hypothetical protein